MKAHDDDVIDPTVVATITDVTPSQREAIQEAVEAMGENDVKQRLTADLGDYGTLSLTIEPLEEWSNEGEKGFDRIHVGVGKRKGVKFGRKSTPTDSTDLEDKTWNGVVGIKSKIANMM